VRRARTEREAKQLERQLLNERDSMLARIGLYPRDPHRAFRDTAWWVTWAVTPTELAAEVEQ